MGNNQDSQLLLNFGTSTHLQNTLTTKTLIVVPTYVGIFLSNEIMPIKVCFPTNCQSTSPRFARHQHWELVTKQLFIIFLILLDIIDEDMSYNNSVQCYMLDNIIDEVMLLNSYFGYVYPRTAKVYLHVSRAVNFENRQINNCHCLLNALGHNWWTHATQQ